jgi:ribosomal protein L14E/L6E/L27E
VLIGSVVISTSGRDKGSYFFVYRIDGDYVFLVDGDIRKIERPKKKKLKHVEPTAFFDENIAEKIIKKNKITNQELKKALKAIL